MKTPSPKTLIGCLVAIFVAGLALGAVTSYTLARKSPAQLPSEQKFEEGWLAKYESELSLTPEQVEAIRPLLSDAVARLGGMWYRTIMTMGAIQESVDRKVEPLLNEEQRERLLALIKEGRDKRLRIAGAKFDQQTGQQDHIYYAAAIGDTNAIQRHLQNGVDVNKQDLAFGMAPLAVAAVHGRAEAIAVLIQEGADVNARSPDGNTALHGAAFFGRWECVRRLLENGSDASARNDDGQTPLDSSRAGDWDTIQFIGTMLQVELNKEQVIAGRKAVAELLEQLGTRNPVPPIGNAPAANSGPNQQ